MPGLVNPYRYAAYRYLQLYINDANSSENDELKLAEVRFKVDSTDYPTVNMTGASAPSPLVASANHEVSGSEAWGAFTDVSNTFWQVFDFAGSPPAFPWTLTLDLGAGNGILPNGIDITPDRTRWPTDFDVRVSRDNSNWADVYNSGDVSSGWTQGTLRSFSW